MVYIISVLNMQLYTIFKSCYSNTKKKERESEEEIWLW